MLTSITGDCWSNIAVDIYEPSKKQLRVKSHL